MVKCTWGLLNLNKADSFTRYKKFKHNVKVTFFSVSIFHAKVGVSRDGPDGHQVPLIVYLSMSFGGTDTSTQEERPASGQQLSWGRSAGRSKPIGGRAQLRSACDACHQSKIKCPGGNPCLNCFSGGNRCNYTQASRIGRPKGSKNKPRENKGTLEQRKTDSGNAQLLSQNGNGHATQEHTSPGTARSEEMVMQWVNHGQQQHQKQQQHQGLVLSMDQVHFGSEFAHGFDSMAVPTDIGLPGHGSPSVDSNQDLMEMLDQSLLMENLTNDTSNLVQSMHDAHAQVCFTEFSIQADSHVFCWHHG